MIMVVCEQCGKPVHAKGLCRYHYDKDRLITTINISEKIKKQVKEFSDSKQWSMHKSLNHLLECGLIWIRKQEEARKEWALEDKL